MPCIFSRKPYGLVGNISVLIVTMANANSFAFFTQHNPKKHSATLA